jgi:hypothetical protein
MMKIMELSTKDSKFTCRLLMNTFCNMEHEQVDRQISRHLDTYVSIVRVIMEEYNQEVKTVIKPEKAFKTWTHVPLLAAHCTTNDYAHCICSTS